MEAAAQRCLRFAAQRVQHRSTLQAGAPQCVSRFSILHLSQRRRHSIHKRESRRAFTTSSASLEDGDPPPQPDPLTQTPPTPARRSNIMDNILYGRRVQNENPTPPPPSTKTAMEQLDDVMALMSAPRPRKPTVGPDQVAISEYLDRLTPEDLRHNPQINLRLKPTLGRTQSLDLTRNVDLTRAFRLLESKCSNNNVKVDERTQRIYVRRGQRKKDLRQKRWRALFKEGFLHECGRIRRMRAQGW